MFNKILSLLIKAGVVAIGISGIITTCGSTGFMGAGVTFLYFTVQSNIFAILVMMLFLVNSVGLLIGKRSFVRGWMRLIKYSATIGVTITFLVFVTMLAPLLGVDYLLSYGNFSLHGIVPILMMFDFFYFDVDAPINRLSCLYGALPPLCYFIFFLIGSVTGIRYIDNAFAPYFFLDYQTHGWFDVSPNGLGTGYWFMILFAFIIALCYMFLLLMKVRRGDFKKR